MGAPQLLVLLVVLAVIAAICYGLYALIRKAVRDGRRDATPPSLDGRGDR